MTQSVNLYLPEFRKKQEWLDAFRMVQVAGLLLLLLAVGAGWQHWQLANSQSELQAAETRRVAAVTATADLRASFGSQTPSQTLLDQNQRLQAELDEKRAILSFMRGRQLGNTAGFSPFMADLARYHVQGLSLRAIQLTRDGRSVALSGEVLRAELVPLYLQALNRSDAFRGMNFAGLQISSVAGPASGDATQQVLDFTVSTGN